MKKTTIISLLVLLAFNVLQAQLVSFTFNDAPHLNTTASNDSISCSRFLISSGSIDSIQTAGSYFTDPPYIGESGGWTATDLASAKYFYITVDALPGYTFSLSKILFEAYATAAGPAALSIFINDTPIDTLDLPDSGLINVSDTIIGFNDLTTATIKIAGWDNKSRSTTGGGAFRLDCFSLLGTPKLIPAKDTTSSVTLITDSVPLNIPAITPSEGTTALSLVFTDSANTDGSSTLIDKITFIAGTNNQLTNWTQILDSVKLIGSDFSNGLLGIIKNDSIIFNTQGLLEIADGTSNAEQYQLKIWLNSSLPNSDNKQLEFTTNKNLILCNANGSKVGFANINTGANQLSVQVKATQAIIAFSKHNIYTDSLFNISVTACDQNNNFDIDYNGTIAISGLSNTGSFLAETSLSGNFNQGIFTVNNAKFNSTDTLKINISAPGLASNPVNLIIGKYIFVDDFESGNLNSWLNTQDWTANSSDAIDGLYSLKHNLVDSAGESYISQKYSSTFFGDGISYWQFVLKNGNFDPTSSNKFWYYVMADTSNLFYSNKIGYAVGVNFGNSTDSLSLWKIEKDGTKKLIIETNFDWNENNEVAIQLSRKANGIWQLAYNAMADFSQLVYSDTATENSMTTANYHGLVFNFTTTRAGLLQADQLNFFQINTAPLLLAAEPINGTQVAVYFSESINSSNLTDLANYTLKTTTGTNIEILKAEYNSSTPKQIRLTTEALKTASYTLTVKNISDTDGWIMDEQSMQFNYAEPAKPFDVVINEIMFDPSPVVSLPEYDYLELFNRSENAFNLAGWKIDIGGTAKTLPDTIIETKGYVIITSSSAKASFSSYGKVIGVISTSALTSTGKAIKLINIKNQIIDSVYYLPTWYNNAEKEDGGWSMERINPANTCSGKMNWKASENETGGTPGAVNSVLGNYIDNTVPALLSHKLINKQTVRLLFSENVDTNSISTSNFLINQTYVKSISFKANDNSELYLTSIQDFTAGVNYTLDINQITDNCGNTLSDTTVNFQFFNSELADIVISELMVDPSPVIGLPEAEYIELSNRSNKSINIEGWQLQVGTKTCKLSNYVLKPDSILILCSSSNYETFTNYGNTLSVSGFPSLTNAGVTIQLKDTSGILINSVSYSDSWYQDNEKADGGWSLEMIDLNNLCGQEQNWRASVNDLGGTPGQINSVTANNIDNIPVWVSNVAPITQNQFWLQFSEPVIIADAINPANYSIENLGNPSMVVIDSTTKTSVWLSFNHDFVMGEKYVLNVQNITDNCENTAIDTSINFTFYIPNRYDIVINEIMASPTPSVELPEAEYIELYNRSAYDAHLYNWTINVGNSERNIDYAFIPANEYLILSKTENTILFKSYGKVAGVESLPAISASGTIYLRNNQGLIICATSYSSDWINDDFKADGGYSLERIDFNNADESENNWQVSADTKGGTPGKENSVYTTNVDTRAFNLTDVVPLNEHVVLVKFNKPLAFKFNDVQFFSIDENIGQPDSMVFEEPFYENIKLYFGQSFRANTTYTFTAYTLLTDMSGNTIENSSDRFMLAELAAKKDIIINEVLFNPRDGGADFVELYNRSNKPINLAQLIIATRNDEWDIKSPYPISEDGCILLPGEFRVLSTNSAAIKKQYIIQDNLAFTDMERMPSLANDAGTIVIMDTNALIIDEFSYTSKMQFALLESVKGVSIERINYERETNDKGNWHSAAEQAQWATPGYKNSVFMEQAEVSETFTVEPEAFSPDNDGYNDVVNFHYTFAEPGYVANVTIYNSNGIEIRKLVNNELLAQSGIFTWDGLSNNNEKAAIGIYIVYFEVFNLTGDVKSYKKTCVVSTKM